MKSRLRCMFTLLEGIYLLLRENLSFGISFAEIDSVVTRSIGPKRMDILGIEIIHIFPLFIMLSQTVLTMASRSIFLGKTDFFQNIENQVFLDYLSEVMEELTFPEKQIIVHEGDRAQLIYFIVEGKVKIHVDGIKMAELSQGAHFGDVNILDNQPAPASATTLEASRCLVLHQTQLLTALRKYSDTKSDLVARLYQRQRKTKSTTWQKSTMRDWCARIQNPKWAY